MVSKQSTPKKTLELTSEKVAHILPKRPPDANKGTFGKVLVISGSENYPGAAYLACAASYRVGAGLVTLATTPSVKIIVSRKLPEVTFLDFKEVFKKINNYDVLLIGPGLGQSDQAIEFAREFCTNYSNNRTKTVIDGDGLNILSKIDGWWKKLKADCVLTPHPGEMARLTELTVDTIQADRINMVKQHAEKWHQTVVLKGANTVIVSPNGEAAVSPFANPALATAGTGDVLSGIIAGFLAQGLSTFDAAGLGVYIHGMAGEMLKEKYGDAGILASDLLPILPQVLLHIPKHRIS